MLWISRQNDDFIWNCMMPRYRWRSMPLYQLSMYGTGKKVDFFLIVRSEVKSLSHVMTLCDPMDCSLPGSSVHGIFQARVLEWVATSFSRGSSRPRDRTWVSRIAGRCFTIWATREAPLIARGGAQILKEEAMTKLKVYVRATLKTSQWRTLCSLGP